MTQVQDKLSEKTQSQGSGQSEISHMTQLKAKLAEKIQAHRPRTAKLTKEFADVVIDKVDIGQCIGGARDIRCLVTDISYLDPQEGIRFRGKTIPETFAALPKAPGSVYPTVESFWYFLLTGDVPTPGAGGRSRGAVENAPGSSQVRVRRDPRPAAGQPSDGHALHRHPGLTEGLEVCRSLQLGQVQQDERLGICSTRMPATSSPASP